MELAGIFRSLGSDVTLFIRHDSFLRTFDDIIQKAVLDEYKRIGIKIVSCSNIDKVGFKCLIELIKVQNKGTTAAKSLSLHCAESDQVFEGSSCCSFFRI